MINFFRKKRKTLADDNKALKYTRYAIGEILLVVVGILIALSINTWNEDRKLADEEQYLLTELLSEFNTNLNKIKEDQFLNSNNQNGAIEILDLIQNKTLKNNEQKLDSLFMIVFSYGSFNPSTGVLNEIINSGKLRILKNDTLRNKLSQWPGWIENQQEDIDIRREQLNYYVEPYYVKNAPMRNGDSYMDFSHWSKKYKRKKIKRSNFKYNYEALTNIEFEGVLYKYVLDQDFVLLNDVETEDFIISIIELIKLNIDND